MSLFAELRPDEDAQLLGGKARSLVWLAAHQLRAPKGFVVTAEVFAELWPEVPSGNRLDDAMLGHLDELRARLLRAPWPAGFTDALEARVAAVGASRFAVRSSFATEDSPGQLGAGVYESYLNVPPQGVAEAIRKVFASALAPGAVAYALAHHARPAAEPLSVLVHEFIPGDADGSAAFAPLAMQSPLLSTRRGLLPEPAQAELSARLVEVASIRGATEIEWVSSQGEIVYLQARPFQPARPSPPWSGFEALPAAEGAAGIWRWDAAHNPLPLSAAQAGLVALVDGNCSIGIRQRVLGGYLFYTREGAWIPPSLPPELAEEFFSSLGNAVDTRLAHVGRSPTLEDALSLFLFAYEPIFGVLQPALRRAHADLRAFLEEHVPAAVSAVPILRSRVPSVATQRAELARAIAVAGDPAEARERYLAVFGDEAPIWDVSAPTYAEAPESLLVPAAGEPTPMPDWEDASREVESALAPPLRETWRQLLQRSRTAVALGEADDWLYARTQAVVRRALLGLGSRLLAAKRLDAVDDVFHLPLDVARSVAAGGSTSVDLRAAVEASCKAWSAARSNPPPSPVAPDVTTIRGSGTGGRAIGRVHRHGPGRATDPTRVLVAATLLPTELPLVGAIAIVTDTGGPLDHVAAQARERGIPAVVGAAAASVTLRDGDLVLVDGDAGLVVRLA